MKGSAAKNAASRYSDINVSKDAALDVFHSTTMPRWYNETKRAFPGLEKLPPMAQGVLTSLVFNRGGGMSGDRRREMREVRSAIGNYQGQQSLNYISNRIQAMKRLWVNKGVDGLLTRRDIEASMVRGDYSGLRGY